MAYQYDRGKSRAALVAVIMAVIAVVSGVGGYLAFQSVDGGPAASEKSQWENRLRNDGFTVVYANLDLSQDITLVKYTVYQEFISVAKSYGVNTIFIATRGLDRTGLYFFQGNVLHIFRT